MLAVKNRVDESRTRATLLFQAPQDVIVILMASDPKPGEMVFGPERNGAVRSANINCPDLSFGLKAEGGMMRISLKKCVFLDCQVLHFGGEFGEEFPKVRCGRGSKGVHR